MPYYSNDEISYLPRHVPTPVSGLHAYARQPGVRGGESIEFCVAADSTVAVDIVRHRDRTENAELLTSLGTFDPGPQVVHRGSYVIVEKGVAFSDTFTVETWIRPLGVEACGLVTQDAFELGLNAALEPIARLSSVTVASTPLDSRTWHHLAVVVGGDRMTLYVDGAAVGDAAIKEEPVQHAPLRIGAGQNDAGESAAFFTGDVCAPAVYERALAAEVIAARFTARAVTAETGCVGHWTFEDVSGPPYRDTTGGCDGRPVNYPIRLIAGPGCTEDSDWCSYMPDADPDFGYAIRLFADAIPDCRWPVTATWKVPDELESGQYAARMTDAAGTERYVDFIVAPQRSTARLLCLSSTCTRMAYNYQAFDDEELDYGAYRVHPSYPLRGTIMGARKPAGGPWYRATIDFELPFYDWLRGRGIAHDVRTEWELHEHPELLDDYEVVAIAGHSEYWPHQQYEELRRFVERSGHLLIMSGNTSYWRVSLDLDNAVAEVRKHYWHEDAVGADCDTVNHASHSHQLDHLPGGTMRACGYLEAHLTGVMSNGWTDPPHPGPRTHYTVLAPEHPLFHSPHEVDTSGKFADGAAGYETDCSCRSVLERHGPRQAPAYPPADGSEAPTLETAFDDGLTVLARACLPASDVMDFDDHLDRGEMLSEMIVWERPGHGLVFNAGGVLTAWPLATDENYAGLILNVLERMGLP